MELYIIPLVAFAASILTFFSGFGLGTILTPVFMIFFPIDVAIALTGVVHFFNNLFKLLLVGKQADVTVLLRFGIPAVVFAFIGSYLLIKLADTAPLLSYTLFGHDWEVFPVKLFIGILLIIFALYDLIPFFSRLQFDKRYLPLGGVLSGFFGGLSGNQGALRSAFLIRAGLSKEAFIGTAVVVSCFVDFTRLGVYASRFSTVDLEENITLLIVASISAIAGALLGNKLLKKVTLNFVQFFVAILLLVLSLALCAGFL